LHCFFSGFLPISGEKSLLAFSGQQGGYMIVHQSLLVRWSLLTALLLLLLKVVGELLAYPAVVTTAGAQAPIYLILW